MVGPGRTPPYLEISEAGGSVYRVPLDAARLVLGRDPACSVRLSSDYVSWHHATLERRGERFWISHHATRNGLLLNGRPLSGTAPLNDGDELRVANVRILFRAAEGKGPGATRPYVLGEPPGRPPSTRPPIGVGAPVPTRTHPLTVDLRSRRLLADGRLLPVSLSPQEFTLLAMLCERPGDVRWHDEIGATIWGVNAFDINQIHALVRRVKQKLRPHTLAGHIVAVPGVGYRLE